jgi:hypothetical protein
MFSRKYFSLKKCMVLLALVILFPHFPGSLPDWLDRRIETFLNRQQFTDPQRGYGHYNGPCY